MLPVVSGPRPALCCSARSGPSPPARGGSPPLPVVSLTSSSLPGMVTARGTVGVQVVQRPAAVAEPGQDGGEAGPVVGRARADGVLDRGRRAGAVGDRADACRSRWSSASRCWMASWLAQVAPGMGWP